MDLKKLDYRKFSAVFFVLIFTVTAALPAMSASAYSYSCQAFYGKPYIFEIGWNISDKAAKSYGSAKVSLSDKTSMNVWYEDGLKNDMSDKTVTAALAEVLNRLKADCPSLSKPIVLSIENVGNDPEKLVKQYFGNDDILRYTAVLPFADKKTQQTYLKKAYNNDDAAFFSVTLDTLGSAGLTKRYLGKAYEDDEIAFFAICLDKLEDVMNGKDFAALANTYAEKAYGDDSIAFFAVLSDKMSNAAAEAWSDRAVKDGKTAFASIFDGYWEDFDDKWEDFDDDWDDFDDKWDSYENYVNSSDHAKYGVTYKDGHYYYNNEPVRYFVDVQRSDSSAKIATVETNPNGKAAIKIVRDKDGNITGVEKLTAKEIKKYFGDAED